MPCPPSPDTRHDQLPCWPAELPCEAASAVHPVEPVAFDEGQASSTSADGPTISQSMGLHTLSSYSALTCGLVLSFAHSPRRGIRGWPLPFYACAEEPIRLW